MTTSSTSAVPQANRWPAFIVTIAVAVTTILDLVKVNVTIAPMEQTIGLTPSQAQIIVAGYVLCFGIILVPAGRLGDIWNRKAMFIIGLIMFSAASLYCSLAPATEHLVAARLIQGDAAGTLMPQVIGLIQNLFQGSERGRAFGIFGASIGLGTAFGPTIGGIFIGTLGPELGWRWTFGMNVPLGLLILPFAIWLIPKSQKQQQSKDLDLIGTLLLALTVLLLMLPFVLTSGDESDSSGRWWLLAAAAATGTCFVLWERRYAAAGRQPVIDIGLFRWPSYRNGVIITTLMFAMMPPTFFVLTLYNQQGLGYAAVIVGMVTIPFAITSAIAAGLSGKHTHKHAATLVFAGLIIFSMGLIGIITVGVLVDAEHTPVWMAVVLGFGGIGQGLVMSANQMRTMTQVPLESAGVGGSFMQVGQRLGNAIGIAVATSIFFAVIAGLGTPDAAPGVDQHVYEATYRQAFVTAVITVFAMSLTAITVAGFDVKADRKHKRTGEHSAS